jgi:hypothetical protein
MWGCLNATPERRGKLRVPYEVPVQLAPMGDGVPGEGIAARTRDVSLLGMSVMLSRQPPPAPLCVLVSLPSRPEPTPIKVRVVHVRECKGGGYEVGLAFA